MTPPVGHIVNPRATRGGAAAETPDAVMTRAPEDFAGLDAAMAEMRAAGVTRIAIEGGDGTVREALTRAFDIWDGGPPAFAIIPRGNTNLIAKHVGAITREDLPRLGDGAFTRRTLPVLKAERSGAAPLRGFILGAGAYEKVTRYARAEIGARHGPQVILAVLKLLRNPDLRAPQMIGFAPDGGEAKPAPRTVVALTTFPGRLIFGLNPFWAESAAPLRWLDVAGDPPRLPAAALWIALGRPRRWMAGAYRAGCAEMATLTLDTPFVMDGETFDACPDGPLRLSAAETATFLSRR